MLRPRENYKTFSDGDGSGGLMEGEEIGREEACAYFIKL